MACNSNYVATVDINCWLSSKNSPHQTMCACSHGGGNTLEDRCQQTLRCQTSIAGCTLHWETMNMVP